MKSLFTSLYLFLFQSPWLLSNSNPLRNSTYWTSFSIVLSAFAFCSFVLSWDTFIITNFTVLILENLHKKSIHHLTIFWSYFLELSYLSPVFAVFCFGFQTNLSILKTDWCQQNPEIRTVLKCLSMNTATISTSLKKAILLVQDKICHKKRPFEAIVYAHKKQRYIFYHILTIA